MAGRFLKLLSHWKKEDIKHDYREVTHSTHRNIIGVWNSDVYTVPKGYQLMIDSMSVESIKSAANTMLIRIWIYELNKVAGVLIHIHGNTEASRLFTEQVFPFGMIAKEETKINFNVNDINNRNVGSTFSFHGWEVPLSGDS